MCIYIILTRCISSRLHVKRNVCDGQWVGSFLKLLALQKYKYWRTHTSQAKRLWRTMSGLIRSSFAQFTCFTGTKYKYWRRSPTNQVTRMRRTTSGGSLTSSERSLSLSLSLSLSIYIYIYIYIYKCINMYISINKYISTYIYIYIHVDTYIYIRIYMYMCIYIHLHMYMYMYIS
jgi:hypothetical protein